MKKIIERFKAETPIFWAKIRNVAGSVLVVCTTVWTSNQALGLDLPVMLLTALKYAILALTIITIQSQLTTK